MLPDDIQTHLASFAPGLCPRTLRQHALEHRLRAQPQGTSPGRRTCRQHIDVDIQVDGSRRRRPSATAATSKQSKGGQRGGRRRARLVHALRPSSSSALLLYLRVQQALTPDLQHIAPRCACREARHHVSQTTALAAPRSSWAHRRISTHVRRTTSLPCCNPLISSFTTMLCRTDTLRTAHAYPPSVPPLRPLRERRCTVSGHRDRTVPASRCARRSPTRTQTSTEDRGSYASRLTSASPRPRST